MKKEFDQIEKKAKFRSSLMVSAFSAFFTLQFGVGYYCIFEVDWLGWDLVEPVTYTVSQGGFVAGLIYMYRNRKRCVEYSMMDEN